jgi:Cu-processing system permease protein
MKTSETSETSITSKTSKTSKISGLLFRELVRDKVFLTLSGASVILVFGSLILNEMVVGQEIKATKDLGLSVMNIFSLFILIFLGVNQISRDLSNKSLYLMFSKPVTRPAYLVGGAISIMLTVVVGVVVIMGTILLLSVLQGEVWIGGVLAAGYLTLLEMTVLMSFAILYAVITSPQLAMFLTLLTYVIGHTLQQAAVIVERSSNVVLKYTVLTLHALLPNLEYFNRKPEIVYAQAIPFEYYMNATMYSLAYGVLVFVLAVMVFKRKEL